MTLIRIGGVPEHFNWPWHLTLGEGAARAAGVDAEWQEFPDGSGAMAQALREQRLDAAMLLTEGAVAGIAAGGGFKIVSVYTESPLIWGIHVPASSRLRAVADLTGARYAISRRGSGSHLMAFVHARERGWPLDRLELVVVRDLKGAIDAFAQGSADVFFWEKFMTKPLVDDGRFRRVADFTAPRCARCSPPSSRARPPSRPAQTRPRRSPPATAYSPATPPNGSPAPAGPPASASSPARSPPSSTRCAPPASSTPPLPPTAPSPRCRKRRVSLWPRDALKSGGRTSKGSSRDPRRTGMCGAEPQGCSSGVSREDPFEVRPPPRHAKRGQRETRPR